MPPVTAAMQRKREEVVREHMDSENRHEFDATLETFEHPRYEIIPTGDVYDGPEEVMAYFEETRRAFPDQRNELVRLHHSDEAVVVEGILRGTHDGPLRGLPPTGRSFEMPFVAFFVFEGDGLVCERVYFNSGTILEALGVARSPLSLTGRLETVVTHPVTIGRGVIRRLTGR
jgi:steroid delta-isomerase-like uncharacterized protein